MEEIRDYVIIVAVILLGTIMFALTLAIAFVGWKLLKGVRWVRRQHDNRLAPLVTSAAAEIGSMTERMAGGSGGLELARAGIALVQSRRKRRKKSRLARLRQTVSALRPG